MSSFKIQEEQLYKLLATTYVLYNKTQNYHWNIKSRDFVALHTFFQEHYLDFQNAIDEIAELIVMYGGKVNNATLKDFSQYSDIKNDLAKCEDDTLVLQDLLKDHKKLVEMLSTFLTNLELYKPVEDLFITRLKFHKKVEWMLEASLSGK